MEMMFAGEPSPRPAEKIIMNPGDPFSAMSLVILGRGCLLDLDLPRSARAMAVSNL